MNPLKTFGFVVSSLLIAGTASATMLSGGLNIDNGYVAYLSTSDNTQGQQISAGQHWPTTYTFADINLSAGQDYFLHIYAYDMGWIAGFLGDFSLTGGDHTFTNGQTSLTTNTTDWAVSTIGWQDYKQTQSLGSNGVSPWGTRAGIASSAEWIWSADAYNDNTNYFTTAISAAAVPEPGAMFLLGLGMAGLMITRRKSK